MVKIFNVSKTVFCLQPCLRVRKFKLDEVKQQKIMDKDKEKIWKNKRQKSSIKDSFVK